MKLHGNIRIGGKTYVKGTDIPRLAIYPYFLFHMLFFGVTGFAMVYSSKPAPISFIFIHGGVSIAVYTMFYMLIFGLDEVKWMFINAGLGVLGIYTQISWLLSLFGKRISDYPICAQVVPFSYYVLYTFLVRHALLDFTQSREDENKTQKVEYCYIAASIMVSITAYYLND